MPDSIRKLDDRQPAPPDPMSDLSIWTRLSSAETLERFVSLWLQMQSGVVGDAIRGVVVMGAADTGPFTPAGVWPDDTEIDVDLSAAAELAMTRRQAVVREYIPGTAKADGREPCQALAFPIVVDDQIYGVAALEVRKASQEEIRRAMRQIQWGMAWLENLIRRRTLTPRDRLVTVLELVASALDQVQFQAAAMAVVTELATALRCDWVAYASLKRKHAVLRAISHSASVGQSTNVMRAIANAMNESLDQHDVVLYPPPKGGELRVTRAHERLAEESGEGQLCTIPLSDRRALCGALTLKFPAGRELDYEIVETCKHLGAVIGPVLESKRREDRWLVQKAWDSFTGFAGRLFGPRHLTLKFVSLLIAALIAWLAVAEGDYLVAADATLEGTVQRVVTAPMDGYIEDAFVRAGNTVEDGQLLGRMEAKDLKLERSRWISQREQKSFEYRQARAANDRAQALILKAQIEQADARLAFLAQQLERVDIVAPFGGIVVSGDLSQMLGAPIQRGQVLFEIAPLDSYRIMIEVDEREISRVSLGQTGTLALAGLPGEPLTFEVGQITPISETVDGRNYFRVEAALTSSSELLRPGMEGIGKIFIEKRKLLWIWTRDFIQWLRFWIWSWWPSVDAK